MSHLLEVKNLDVKFDTDEGRITAVEIYPSPLIKVKSLELLVSQDLENLLLQNQ